MRLVRQLVTGLLVVLLIATAIPIAYGAWQLTIGGVRLLSIARADKPLTLALGAALALLAALPRMRGRVPPPIRPGVLSPGRLRDVGVRARTDPTVMGQRALYQAPYGWLMRLPGFDGLRVPARFWMMAVACLSVVGALAVDRLSGRRRGRGRAGDRWSSDRRVAARVPGISRAGGAALAVRRLGAPRPSDRR